MTTNMAVVEDIRLAVGHKALYMMGASHLVGSTDESGSCLSFRIKGSPVCNHLSISIVGDLYTIKAHKIYGMTCKLAREVEMIYVDSLRSIIEDITKLRTSI